MFILDHLIIFLMELLYHVLRKLFLVLIFLFSRHFLGLVWYFDFDMLFTGDVGERTERELVAYLKKCEVLKVAHHGSKYSNSQLLLERVCPGLALISCSEDNSYGHPHKETLKRLEAVGCKIMTTAESGAVKIRIGKKIEVYGFVK